MSSVIFISNVNTDGTLHKGSLEVLSAAAQLAKDSGGSLSVGLIGSAAQKGADSIAGCGAQKFYAVSGAEFEAARYSSDAAAVEALAKAAGAELILVPGSSRFARCGAGAAHRLGGRCDSHVGSIIVEGGKISIQRWFYRQRMIGTLSRETRPWLMLIDSGVFEAYSGEAGSAALETVDVAVPATAGNVTVKGTEAASSDAQTIKPDAEMLFVAGAGWTKKQADGATHLDDAKDRILTFLDKAQASLGSSKSLVDLHAEGGETLSFMSHLNQVGQTGSSPRHQKGLATCCHGEEPHVVGWRFVNERRAINTDANCGWAQGKADVLYVGDAFEIMEKVNNQL